MLGVAGKIGANEQLFPRKSQSRDGGNLLLSAPTRELLPSRFVGPFKARLIAGFF
jgi:hypothetical protein